MTAEMVKLVDDIWALLGPAGMGTAMQAGTYNSPEWVSQTRNSLLDLIETYDEGFKPTEASLEAQFEQVASNLVDNFLTKTYNAAEEPTPPVPVRPFLIPDTPAPKTAAEYIRTAPASQRLSAGGGSAVVGPGGSIRICGKVTSYLDDHITPADSELAGMDMSQDLTPTPLDGLIIKKSYVGKSQAVTQATQPQRVHVHESPRVDTAYLGGNDDDINFQGYEPSRRVFASASDILRYEQEVGGVSDPDLVAAIEGELQAQEELPGYETGTGIRNTFNRSEDGTVKLRTTRKRE